MEKKCVICNSSFIGLTIENGRINNNTDDVGNKKVLGVPTKNVFYRVFGIPENLFVNVESFCSPCSLKISKLNDMHMNWEMLKVKLKILRRNIVEDIVRVYDPTQQKEDHNFQIQKFIFEKWNTILSKENSMQKMISSNIVEGNPKEKLVEPYQDSQTEKHKKNLLKLFQDSNRMEISVEPSKSIKSVQDEGVLKYAETEKDKIEFESEISQFEIHKKNLLELFQDLTRMEFSMEPSKSIKSVQDEDVLKYVETEKDNIEFESEIVCSFVDDDSQCMEVDKKVSKGISKNRILNTTKEKYSIMTSRNTNSNNNTSSLLVLKDTTGSTFEGGNKISHSSHRNNMNKEKCDLNKNLTSKVSKQYKCDECSKVYAHYCSLWRHKTQNHQYKKNPGKKLRCSSKKLLTKKKNKRSSKYVDGNPIFFEHVIQTSHCDDTDDTTKLSKVIDPFQQKILVKKKPKKNKICKICKKAFCNTNYLRNHEMRIHRVKGKYYCKKCKRIYYTLYNLKIHTALKNCKPKQLKRSIRRSSSSSPEVVNLVPPLVDGFIPVSETSSTKVKLELDEPFMCNICGKIFMLQSTVTQHMKSHQMSQTNKIDNKKTSCFVCNEEFLMESQMWIHFEKDHGKMNDPHVELFKEIIERKTTTTNSPGLRVGQLHPIYEDETSVDYYEFRYGRSNVDFSKNSQQIKEIVSESQHPPSSQLEGINPDLRAHIKPKQKITHIEKMNVTAKRNYKRSKYSGQHQQRPNSKIKYKAPARIRYCLKCEVSGKFKKKFSCGWSLERHMNTYHSNSSHLSKQRFSITKLKSNSNKKPIVRTKLVQKTSRSNHGQQRLKKPDSIKLLEPEIPESRKPTTEMDSRMSYPNDRTSPELHSIPGYQYIPPPSGRKI